MSPVMSMTLVMSMAPAMLMSVMLIAGTLPSAATAKRAESGAVNRPAIKKTARSRDSMIDRFTSPEVSWPERYEKTLAMTVTLALARCSLLPAHARGAQRT